MAAGAGGPRTGRRRCALDAPGPRARRVAVRGRARPGACEPGTEDVGRVPQKWPSFA